MTLLPRRFCLLSCTFALLVGCDSSRSHAPAGLDANQDHVADDLGAVVDADGDGIADGIDINHDGKIDGPGIDTNHDGKVDALALDTDCDGIFDSLDTNGDGKADLETSIETPARDVPGCMSNPFGAAGASNNGGSTGTGGSSSAGRGGSASGGGPIGAGGTGGGSAAPSELGKGIYQGTGKSTDQYAESDIYRDGVGYKFIANGWGSGWQSQDIAWNGTSFTVASLNGNQGANYSPAGYPSVFCGLYSMKQSVGGCGLPGALSSLKGVKTGWRWKANGNNGQYNAAWDIWLGNGNNLSAYLMVWLRDPPGQQPAGSGATAGATVPGLPGTWNIWTGNVNGHPIVNYVRAEGQDLSELEYDVMDVYRDAIKHNYNLPGANLIAVAVGFEVWNGPISNLVTDDFYVNVE